MSKEKVKDSALVVKQEIEDELTCSICLRIFHLPTTTPCGHTFCRKCIQKTFESASARTCGLCRASLDYFDLEDQTSNVLITNLISKLCSEQYAQRLKEEEEEKEEDAHKCFKKIALGNYHSLVASNDTNVHRWTVFVKTAQNQQDLENELPIPIEDLIDQVIIDLHPTFSPSRIAITSAPFHLTRLGWGVFTVRIQVIFKDFTKKPPMDFNHLLSFSGQGSVQVHTVEFDARNIPMDTSEQEDVYEEEEELY